jgi:predicted hydrocarbon binding protein
MSGDIELNEIGILKRREIEARILAPILDALGEELGRERVLEVVRKTVVKIAQAQGRELATKLGRSDLHSFASSLDAWSKDGALELRILNQDAKSLEFDVTECKYAAMYRNLGIEELGAILSCSRDAAFVEGFNEDITLTRTQTIMQGAHACDFRFSAGTKSTRVPE